MSQVWTRFRAGTGTRRPTDSSRSPLVRNPVPDHPQIHLIELPLDAALESTQVYLIEGQPLTLVDTGVQSEASRATLELALEELGYGLADIERIVVTHAHRDHFGLAQTIRELGGEFECCAHAEDAGTIEDFDNVLAGRVGEMESLFAEFGVPPKILERMQRDRVARLPIDHAAARPTPVDRILREGDRIEWKDWGLTVRHSPGHTPGHLLLEDEEAGLLLCGDQVMGQAIPNAENFYLSSAEAASMPAPGDALLRRPRYRGLVEMRRSLRRLRKRKYRTLLPGYGGVLTRPDRAIRDTLLYYDVRLQRIDRGLRQLDAMGADVTGYELWKAFFPGEEASNAMRAHLLLVIGALDCLEEDGLLVTERRPDGVLTHHHT